MRLYTYAASIMVIITGLFLIPVALLNVRLDDLTLNLLLLATILTLIMIIVDEILIRRGKVSSEGKQVDVFGLDEVIPYDMPVQTTS